MPVDEVLVTSLPGDRRAAARERGTLVRLALAGDDSDLRVADIILGRVARISPSIGAAFVEVGTERAGILMRQDTPDGRLPSPGAAIVVRISRVDDAEKGPKLSAHLPEAVDAAIAARAQSSRPPCVLARGNDPVKALLLRVVGPHLRQVVVDDPATLVELRSAVPAVADRLQPWTDPTPLFIATGVEEAIEDALTPIVALPSGGRIIIEETAAFTAIDVDTGAMADGSRKTAALACGLEAATAIGREIVLRDLAGRVVIDFIPLRRPAERQRVMTALHAALADDDRDVRLGGWTRLGAFEMIRERLGPSLSRRLSAPCDQCAGSGRVLSARWVAGDALRAVLAESHHAVGQTLVIATSAPVLAVLRGPLSAALRAVEQKLGSPLPCHEDPCPPAAGFRLALCEAAAGRTR
jgi:ribonuclease G